MKKTITILLAFCLCVGMCACAPQGAHRKTTKNRNAPTTEPPQYEDTLIEKLKIGEPLSRAEEVFGAPIFSENYTLNERYEMRYNYNDVTIYNLPFTPTVYTGYEGEVLCYSYSYYSEVHSAAYEEAYDKLLTNYIRLLGEPDESGGTDNLWNFEDGTRLNISNLTLFKDTYRIYIQYYLPASK